MTPVALLAAFSLMTAAPPPDGGGGEPLPPGAPSDPYELSAWCYGALNEYLIIYDEVKPELRAIDREFGASVVEAEPYQSDMAAARDELHVIGDAVTDAEKASPQPIAQRGVAAMRQGQSIWSIVEGKTRRELARAWMLWALPDKCDSNARDLAARSLLLGKALSFNTGAHVQAPAAHASQAPETPAPSALDAADTAQTAPIATPQPGAQSAAAQAARASTRAAADLAVSPPAEAAPTVAGNPPAADMTSATGAPVAEAAPHATAPPAAAETQPLATAPSASPPGPPPSPAAEHTPARPPSAASADESQEPSL